MCKEYSSVRGFNYEPSYASTICESWKSFDAKAWELELRRGKDYFPGINTIRIWLDWDAWVQNPEPFKKNLNTALELVNRICKAKAIVCLLNRWHNSFLDAGGLYIDHFMQGWSWVGASDEKFTPYIKDIVGSFKNDERIMLWDYCNEPFTYKLPINQMNGLEKQELAFLRQIHADIKEVGASQPVGVSVFSVETLALIEPISDVLLIHPYYIASPKDINFYKNSWLVKLDEYEKLSKSVNKPLLITECCWGGGIDWQTRVEIMKIELSEFAKRKIGFLPHALHHSLIADLHQPQYGPVDWEAGSALKPGSMEFIDANGFLRLGHEAFNLY